jgi:hypothetical protein
MLTRFSGLVGLRQVRCWAERLPRHSIGLLGLLVDRFGEDAA